MSFRPSMTDEITELKSDLEDAADEIVARGVVIRELREENEKLKRACEFKQSLLIDDDQNSLYIENDRYWVKGAHIKKMLASYNKVLAVAEAGRRLYLYSPWNPDYYGFEELRAAVKAWSEK